MTDWEFHPLADFFPLLEDAELDTLAEDIRDHGQREPIIIYEDKIIDGRNRYRACLKAGVVPEYCDFDPKKDGDPFTFVISPNLHRRHLNESQRAMIAAKLAKMTKGRPRAGIDGGQQAARRVDVPDKDGLREAGWPWPLPGTVPASAEAWLEQLKERMGWNDA
jgi:hypothetical protein